MKIKSIRLEHIGRFSDISINIAPTVDKSYNNTILIGNNGSGKSTILEAIALSLSWFVGRVKSEKGSGNSISELKIRNENNSAAITINIIDNSQDFTWTLTKARKGKKGEKATKLEDLNKLVNTYRENYSSNPSLSFPLIIFYDANRGVLDIPLKIRGKHNFEQLDGYDNSLKGMVDYRRFFEWYREREDAENEEKLKFIRSFNSNNYEDIKKYLSYSDRQLNAVRSALEIFLPDFKNIRVERKPRLHMAVDKNDQHLNLEQLSQGEKLTIALVGDIARRLSIMNPQLENPLFGNGIVLIDEAELHLHPRWQRTLVHQLGNAFPNCQFILTTHSPLLISDNKDIICYSLDDGEISSVNYLYGSDVNEVLLDVMNTDIRSLEVEKIIDEFLLNVQERNITEAKKSYKKLSGILPEDHVELAKARLHLKRLALRNESDSKKS